MPVHPVRGMNMAPTRISQVAVVAQDVSRATAFYRDRLRLPLLFEAPGPLSFFDCGGTRIMITGAENDEQAGMSSVVYYEVPDLDSSFRELVADGIAFEREPHRIATLGHAELWMAFLRDSEGNLLGLSQERPISAQA
jgi:methylmalonyl-CoA/ethylmalonyl-CoA epimerase